MAYTRKTVDRWDIETNYGYGWDVECSYYAYAEVKRDLPGYREHMAHYGGTLRVIKRRERVE